MTYALAGALQKAVYQRLALHPGLAGVEVHDAPLPEAQAGTGDFVTLGDEVVRDRSSKTSAGAAHDFEVRVHSGGEGFARAKAIAATVCDALIDAALVLERGHLIGLRFIWAAAERREAPETRRITLRFRALLEEVS